MVLREWVVLVEMAADPFSPARRTRCVGPRPPVAMSAMIVSMEHVWPLVPARFIAMVHVVREGKFVSRMPALHPAPRVMIRSIVPRANSVNRLWANAFLNPQEGRVANFVR